MRSAYRPLTIVFLLLAAVAVLIASSRLMEVKEVVPWRTDLAGARAEARRTHKAVFADFTADWCGPCQGLKRTLWSDREVAAALQNFVPVSINIDRNNSLAEQMGVSGIPAFFIIDGSGKVLRRSEGAMAKDEFLAWLQPARAADAAGITPQ